MKLAFLHRTVPVQLELVIHVQLLDSEWFPCLKQMGEEGNT